MSVAGDEADVVIVGAGAGGAAAAWALANAGVRVLVLEAGPRFDPFRDYRLDAPDWERRRFPTPEGSQGRYTYGPLQPLDERFEGLRSWNHITGLMNPTETRWGGGYAHVRGVGGSTLHFTGESHRLHPAAFKLASRYGQGADWPIDYRALEPYYVRAEKLIGVAGPADNPVRWRSEPFPLPAHPYAYASRKLLAATAQLDLSWEANALAVLSRPYDGRPGCNYCANCNRGCPRTDKGSADVTFARKAEATGRCRIETGCTVQRLLPGRRDRIAGVEFVDGNGRQRRLSPRLVVLAGGAVETPRLLLLSANRHAPEGLGNESGQVGRNFLETLFWSSAGLHDEPLGSHRGLPSDIICWDHNGPDGIDGVVGGCRFSISTAEADLIGPINYAKRVVPGWGQAHKQAMREQFGRVLSVAGIAESLPHAGTFIDLDPEQRDRFGAPVARIHSQLDGDDLTRLRFMADRCRQMLQACGIAKPFEEYGASDFFLSTHVFGTCRMGTDARRSVVDASGRTHRWRNLYIADGSVFPSSGGGESPSLTIEALAIRSAEIIRERLVRREV